MAPRVTLLYPPATHPRSPHLPLPALTAYLRQQGIETQQRDVDLESFLALMRPMQLRRAGEALRRTGPRTPEQKRLLARAEALEATAEDALAVMWDRQRFLSPNQRVAAEDTIHDALDLLSAAAPRAVRYRVHFVQHGYSVEGVDDSRFGDLLQASADPDANLFAEVWRDGVLADLEAQRPDVVGISITARHQLIAALMLARMLREREHFVVLGGTFIAKFSESIAKLPELFDTFADGVVTFEGESALVELLEQLGTKRDFGKVPNYLYRDGSTVRAGPTHLENVAELPTPDFDGLPLGQYLSPDLVLPLMLGKGCYYDQCKFCESSYINRLSRKRYRQRPMERVLDDVTRLAERHGCTHFMLADEAVPSKSLCALADGVVARGRDDLSFAAYVRFEPGGFTPEKCRQMAEGGVRRLFFGLESASEKTLAHMAKGIRLSDVTPSLESCEEAGIVYHVFGLVGFPEEDPEEVKTTLDFFFDEMAPHFALPGNSFDVSEVQIHLRSDYGEQATELGLKFDDTLVEGEFAFGLGTRWNNSRGISREQLHALLARRWPHIPSRVGFLWPGLEEWGLVYAAAYYHRHFPYQLELPTEQTGRAYRLAISPNVVTLAGEDGSVRLLIPPGELLADATTYQRLRDRAPKSVATILREWGLEQRGEDEARAAVRQALWLKVLQLEPEGPIDRLEPPK